MKKMIFRFKQEHIDKLNEGRWTYTPPDTPHEVFHDFAKRNPEIVKLKEKFDLEVDL